MIKSFIFIFILLFVSCSKEEVLIQKTISNPKQIFNNTSNWTISKYTNTDLDSTSLFSKYWVKFNEDPTCAERVIFYQPFHEVWAVWETYDYADGTVIRFWIPPNNQFTRFEGEWYFNRLTENEIHLFKDNKQLIFKR